MHPPLAGSYLVLETTNRCSLACVHCTVSEGPAHPHHAQPGFMPPARFEAVLADLARVGARFDTLIPFWLGEPLLHPEFGVLYRAGLRAAAEAGTFQRVELHTNATHLGRDRVRIALNSASTPQTWHLSVDAATPRLYKQIKGRDDHSLVVSQITSLLEGRAQTGARWPRPVLQMIVGENNAHEVEAFARTWTATCTRLRLPVRLAAQQVPAGDDVVVFFRQLDAPTPAAQERANTAYRAAMARLGLPLPRPEATPTRVEPGPGVCGSLWKSPVVGWDGRVTTCVRDNRFENLLGNVDDTPLSALWWGERMRRSRAEAACGRYGDLPACTGCYIPRSANHTDIRPAEIAAWA